LHIPQALFLPAPPFQRQGKMQNRLSKDENHAKIVFQKTKMARKFSFERRFCYICIQKKRKRVWQKWN